MDKTIFSSRRTVSLLVPGQQLLQQFPPQVAQLLLHQVEQEERGEVAAAAALRLLPSLLQSQAD